MGRELFKKLIVVPLLLRFWIFNNILIFWAFYGLSSPNHFLHELPADLISLFPVSMSLLVHIKLGLYILFRRRPEKESFRAPTSTCWGQVYLFSVLPSLIHHTHRRSRGKPLIRFVKWMYSYVTAVLNTFIFQGTLEFLIFNIICSPLLPLINFAICFL